MEYLFLFNSAGDSKFCGGVFSTREKAEQWILRYKLSGILTKYPLDMGVYDWAIENHKFNPKKEIHFQPDFIGGFSSATQEHYHYESGNCLDEEIDNSPVENA
ncbi:MAG TPA: hypothetical protein VGN00_21705 [Puia sp.]|jgi:hypothetical protein